MEAQQPKARAHRSNSGRAQTNIPQPVEFIGEASYQQLHFDPAYHDQLKSLHPAELHFPVLNHQYMDQWHYGGHPYPASTYSGNISEAFSNNSRKMEAYRSNKRIKFAHKLGRRRRKIQNDQSQSTDTEPTQEIAAAAELDSVTVSEPKPEEPQELPPTPDRINLELKGNPVDVELLVNQRITQGELEFLTSMNGLDSWGVDALQALNRALEVKGASTKRKYLNSDLYDLDRSEARLIKLDSVSSPMRASRIPIASNSTPQLLPLSKPPLIPNTAPPNTRQKRQSPVQTSLISPKPPSGPPTSLKERFQRLKSHAIQQTANTFISKATASTAPMHFSRTPRVPKIDTSKVDTIRAQTNSSRNSNSDELPPFNRSQQSVRLPSLSTNKNNAMSPTSRRPISATSSLSNHESQFSTRRGFVTQVTLGSLGFDKDNEDYLAKLEKHKRQKEYAEHIRQVTLRQNPTMSPGSEESAMKAQHSSKTRSGYRSRTSSATINHSLLSNPAKESMELAAKRREKMLEYASNIKKPTPKHEFDGSDVSQHVGANKPLLAPIKRLGPVQGLLRPELRVLQEEHERDRAMIDQLKRELKLRE